MHSPGYVYVDDHGNHTYNVNIVRYPGAGTAAPLYAYHWYSSTGALWHAGVDTGGFRRPRTNEDVLPESGSAAELRSTVSDAGLKVNEGLSRRVAQTGISLLPGERQMGNAMLKPAE